jgi:MYXO-CTERM domain-containing protein
MTGGASGTGGDLGGGGSAGAGGGGGGEHIGVAQEADSLCCCTVPPEGQSMSCSLEASCPPYTTNTPGACGSPDSTGSCSTSGVRPAAGGAVEVLALLLALAAFGAIRRRFV